MSTVELWYQGAAAYLDDMSLFTLIANQSKWNACDAEERGHGIRPENLCCPISMEIMEQPVLAADGFTYDRHAIEAWLARGKTTSPTTGAPLAHVLTPSRIVKSMIAEYKESKG